MATRRMSEALLREALEAWKDCDNNVTEAAKSLGIPRPTLDARLQRAKLAFPDDVPAKPAPVAEDTHKLQRRVKELESALDAARQPKVKVKGGKSSRTRKGDFKRVVVPDSHGCHIDPEASAAFLADLEELAPAEIVMLGDHLDCGGFLAQHQTIGYVAESQYTFDDDVAACNSFLDEIQKRAPGAAIHYLQGNHERRLEKWCVTQALRSSQDADYLLSRFGLEANLNLSKRGIKHYEQGKFYGDLAIPSTIKLGHCYFTHGSRTNKHAASAMLDDFGGNVVFGHTHRMDSFAKRTVHEGVLASWCPGCLCKLQPLWQHTNVTAWSHGYGLQLVRNNGNFLHINVPIVDGKSLLMPLLRRAS